MFQVSSHKVPIPVGSRVGNVLCSSAIAGKDPATGRLAETSAEQVRLAFENVQRFLTSAAPRWITW